MSYETLTYVAVCLSLTGPYSIMESHFIWFQSFFVCFPSILKGSGIITPNEEEIIGGGTREVERRGIQCDHLGDIYENRQLSYASATYRGHNSSWPSPLVWHSTSQKCTNYLSESVPVNGWDDIVYVSKVIQLVYTDANICNSVLKSSEGIWLRHCVI